MRWTVIVAFALMLCTPALWGLDEKTKDKDKTKDKPEPSAAAKQFKALQEEAQKGQQQLFKNYQEAKKDEDKQKVFEKAKADGAVLAAKCLKLAQDNPSDPVAFDALMFSLTAGMNNVLSADAEKALAILSRDHIQNPKIVNVFQFLQGTQSPAAEKLLLNAFEKNPKKEVKAQACYSLGSFYKSQADAFAAKKMVAAGEKSTKEAEKYFDLVIQKFADVKGGRRNLAESAKGELFEIRNLAIGKVIPEITGEDGDGKKFKLADYRGKVVVIDFWARW